MPKSFIFLCQLGVLVFFAWGADQLVDHLSLPIPGNVLGIVLLFSLLCTGIVKESHIDMAAGFLLRHLVFFFIPVAVGLMDWGQVFYEHGWILLISIVFSAALPLCVVAWLSRALQRRRERGEKV